MYFITMRIHGTLPLQAEAELKALAEQRDKLEGNARRALERRIFIQTENWLHNSRERCYLRDQAVADMVAQSIVIRHERGIWEPYEYIVMPNHIHMFIQLTDGTLRQAMLAFKRWTAQQAIRMLNIKTRPFWQEDWFDHFPRSEQECERIIEYIRNNPKRKSTE